MVFNGENSLETASKYVHSRDYKNVLLHVFSNHVDAPGIPRKDEWSRQVSPDFVGTNPDKIPFDLTSAINYYFDLADKLPKRTVRTRPLTLDQIDQFYTEKPETSVDWTDAQS
jgi:hypothetical protein